MSPWLPVPFTSLGNSSRRLKTQNASRQEHQELGAHGLKVIEQLLEGVEDDVMHLVDLTSKGQQQLCVPMLGSTLRHQAKVRHCAGRGRVRGKQGMGEEAEGVEGGGEKGEEGCQKKRRGLRIGVGAGTGICTFAYTGIEETLGPHFRHIHRLNALLDYSYDLLINLKGLLQIIF